MTQKTAKIAMTPISETFSLDINAKLDVYESSNLLSVFIEICDADATISLLIDIQWV